MKHSTEGQLFTELVLQVFKLSGMMTTEGDTLTREFGLSSARWKILGALVKREEPLTVPQIAREMGQSRQSVQRLVEVMSKDGLLEQHVNPNHKRAGLVNLSPKGFETYALLEKKQIHWANQIAEDIREADLNITLTTLEKLSRKF